MLDIAGKMDDETGYELVKEIKKTGVKMFMRKEQGQRFVTIKFSAERLQIPIFNLLSLINEADLYELWFPFCKKSFTVRFVFAYLSLASKAEQSQQNMLSRAGLSFSFKEQRSNGIWFRRQQNEVQRNSLDSFEVNIPNR